MAIFTVNEATTFIYTSTLNDELGAPIILTNLTTLLLTLYNLSDLSIINTRDGQDIKNLNNVTYHATSGLITWSGQVLDTPIVGSAGVETHIALFEWTYAAGVKVGKHETTFRVNNLAKVP